MSLSRSTLEEWVVYVQTALAAEANPEKAAGMQAYMKTDMPFYGVQKPGRTVILKALVRQVEPSDRDDYESLVLALWAMPHREEKYIALGVARHFEQYVVPGSLALYQRLITEGAWWDFVDEVATKLVRRLVLEYPDEIWPVVDPWVNDQDMWLRRAAIICQVGLKEKTDPDRLFRFCASAMAEKEFSIRKAIGWSLREYAKTDPHAVAQFVDANQGRLSRLSYREATKHIEELVS